MRNNHVYIDAIRSRRSVRTFDGTGLSPEEAAQIIYFANVMRNPYGILIDWQILNAKEQGLSSPVITGTDCYIAGKLRWVPHGEEAFGYTFEQVVLFAKSIGIGTTWIAGTMNRAAFERAMELTSDEVMPCVSPLGYPASKMSLREALMRKGIKADSRMPFRELFFKGSLDTPLLPEAAGDLRIPLEMVRLSPSAVNKQPWRVLVCGDTVHFYEKQSRNSVTADGWDVQKIDMGIALCHFALAAEECDVHTEFLLEDPHLPVGELIYTASFKCK